MNRSAFAFWFTYNGRTAACAQAMKRADPNHSATLLVSVPPTSPGLCPLTLPRVRRKALMRRFCRNSTRAEYKGWSDQVGAAVFDVSLCERVSLLIELAATYSRNACYRGGRRVPKKTLTCSRLSACVRVEPSIYGCSRCIALENTRWAYVAQRTPRTTRQRPR